MLTYECRIPMPMHLADFERAHLHGTMEFSKKFTGGGEGVAIVQNESFEGTFDYKGVPGYVFAPGSYEKGQFTKKMFHVSAFVPEFVRLLAPKGSLEVKEISNNSFPYCSTLVTNPGYAKDVFYIHFETINVDGDRGGNNNIYNMSPDVMETRKVVKIDIADNSIVSSDDYNEQVDPTKYTSTKNDQAPLTEGWIKTANPIMCSYKRVTIFFKWWGLQTKVENIISRRIRRMLPNLHRLIFCTTDKWYDLSMTEIRVMEEKTKDELERMRREGSLPAMVSK